MKVNNILKKYIDKTYNPCEDFYKFTCNKYVQKLIDNEEYSTGLDDGSQKALREYKKIIEKPIGNQDDKLTRLTKQLYKSCLDKGIYI